MVKKVNYKGEEDKSQDEKTAAPKHGFIQSAIDVRNITELDKIRRVTDYCFKEFKKLSEQHGFRLLIAMDPVREAIYTSNPASEYEANRLNEIAKELAAKHKIEFLDLGNAMRADYKTSGEKFEFPWDWHWNKKGNFVAGKAIAETLKTPGETTKLSSEARDQ